MPGLSRADSHIVLFVDILKELDIQALVAVFGISKVAQIIAGGTELALSIFDFGSEFLQ